MFPYWSGLGPSYLAKYAALARANNTMENFVIVGLEEVMN